MRALSAGPLLVVLAVAPSCQQPAPLDELASPAGVRTPLPASSSTRRGCAPEPEGGPAAATQGLPIEVTLGPAGTPAPVDEIPFDHRIHAGDCAIPCLSCHADAVRSPVAGLPSGKKCMGCHKFVAKDRPAVQVMAARIRAEQPLRWTRVFELPDFVYFTHRVHLHLRDPIACSVCHGDVATMKTVRQDEPFTMGRCLTCHEHNDVRHDCVVCHR
jgi:hypothetical protein